MNARSTALYGALAFIALVAAYFTWQRPKENLNTELVTVLDASTQSLQKINFDDGTKFIEVEKQDSAFWVKQGYLPGKTPPPAPALTDGGVAPPVVTPPTREVRGNERAETLFSRFSPLEAARALGKLSDEKLKELGLKDLERTLTVTVAGTQRAFNVSKPQTGLVGVYLQDARTSDVYLMQGTLLSELDPGGQMLVDRRLHVFKQPDFDAFSVAVPGEAKKAEFLQKDASIAEKAKISRVGSPDKQEELVKNWHDKVWSRLIVTEVLGRGETPKLGEPKVEWRIEYSAQGKPKGWLELATDSAGGTWARSENTASWVGSHQGAQELITEGKKIAAQTP